MHHDTYFVSYSLPFALDLSGLKGTEKIFQLSASQQCFPDQWETSQWRLLHIDSVWARQVEALFEPARAIITPFNRNDAWNLLTTNSRSTL